MKENLEVRSAVISQGERRETQLALAIMKHRGILSKVAKEVGLGSAQAVRYHIIRSPSLRQVFDESRGKVVDKAEDNIFDAVERGNLQYSKFIVTPLGKDRGYIERREVDKQVVHSVDQQSTGALISMLNDIATMSPEVIEAEFEDMPVEDRKILVQALQAEASEARSDETLGQRQEQSALVVEAAG